MADRIGRRGFFGLLFGVVVSAPVVAKAGAAALPASDEWKIAVDANETLEALNRAIGQVKINGFFDKRSRL